MLRDLNCKPPASKATPLPTVPLFLSLLKSGHSLTLIKTPESWSLLGPFCHLSYQREQVVLAAAVVVVVAPFLLRRRLLFDSEKFYFSDFSPRERNRLKTLKTFIHDEKPVGSA